MQNYYHSIMRGLVLILALIGGSAVAGCDERSDGSRKTPDPSPATPSASGAGSATRPDQPRGRVPRPAGVEPAATTRPMATSRPTIERAEPTPMPPALQLAIELGWDNPYPGEPLPVRLYLSSPRADALIDAANAGTTRPAESPLSNVIADWPAAVRFELFRVNDDQLRPAGVALDWSKLRLPAFRAIPGNRVADWEIPASANLAEGQFMLRATWADTNGPELAAEARFSLAKPQNDQENAEHAERMALEAYGQNRFAEARRWAEEAVKADRQSTTPQRIRMLLAQADACLAMDDLKAGLEIYRAMLKMPLDERLAAELSWKVKVLEKLLAKPVLRPPQPPRQNK
jgi:hypothetical protein